MVGSIIMWDDTTVLTEPFLIKKYTDQYLTVPDVKRIGPSELSKIVND